MPSLKARLQRLEREAEPSPGVIFAVLIVRRGDSEQAAWERWLEEHPREARVPERIHRVVIRERAVGSNKE